MPYWLGEDSIGRDARWSALARLGEPTDRPWSDRKVRERRRALGFSWMRMMSEVALQRDDGYIGRDEALACCDGETWILELLATPVLGKPPFLHRPGDRCSAKNCIDSSPPWVTGWDFRLCAFLKRNPSKAEKDRNEAQKADSRDPVLRKATYERDGGCCRYCRSGPLAPKGMGRAKDRRRALQFDHPDPDRAAEGGDNYVTSCARCNEEKGHRTPEEAGMRRLPAPTPEQIAAWQARGERLYDRPEPGEDSPADLIDNARDNPPDNDHDNQHDNDQPVVDTVVPAVVHDAPTDVDARHETAGGAQDNVHDMGSEGSGSGRGGLPVGSPFLGARGQPVRDSLAPDIYHRRSRAPIATGPPGGDP